MALAHDAPESGRQWRYYRGPQGQDPVRDYLARIDRGDALALRARMKQVRDEPRRGLRVAPEIFEIRASRAGRTHALLFGREGRRSPALVALDAYSPSSRRPSRSRIALAQDHLARWRARGVQRGLGLGR